MQLAVLIFGRVGDVWEGLGEKKKKRDLGKDNIIFEWNCNRVLKLMWL